MFGYDTCVTYLKPAMAMDAAMPARRRHGRDEAPDPISALRQLIEQYCPPDRMAEIDQAIEALVDTINRGHEEAAEREELERLAEIGKRAEQSGADRRPGRASDSALSPARIDRLLRDAAARRSSAARDSLHQQFPALTRIRQS